MTRRFAFALVVLLTTLSASANECGCVEKTLCTEESDKPIQFVASGSYIYFISNVDGALHRLDPTNSSRRRLLSLENAKIQDVYAVDGLLVLDVTDADGRRLFAFNPETHAGRTIVTNLYMVRTDGEWIYWETPDGDRVGLFRQSVATGVTEALYGSDTGFYFDVKNGFVYLKNQKKFIELDASTLAAIDLGRAPLDFAATDDGVIGVDFINPAPEFHYSNYWRYDRIFRMRSRFWRGSADWGFGGYYIGYFAVTYAGGAVFPRYQAYWRIGAYDLLTVLRGVGAVRLGGDNNGADVSFDGCVITFAASPQGRGVQGPPPPGAPKPKSEIRQTCVDDFPFVESVTPPSIVPLRGGTVTITGRGFENVREVRGATLLASSSTEIVVQIDPGAWKVQMITIVTDRFTIDVSVYPARARAVTRRR